MPRKRKAVFCCKKEKGGEENEVAKALEKQAKKKIKK